MLIQVTCPGCGFCGNLPETFIGKKVKCRGCNQPFLAMAEEASSKQPEEPAAAEMIAEQIEPELAVNHEPEPESEGNVDLEHRRAGAGFWLAAGGAAVGVLVTACIFGALTLARRAPDNKGAVAAFDGQRPTEPETRRAPAPTEPGPRTAPETTPPPRKPGPEIVKPGLKPEPKPEPNPKAEPEPKYFAEWRHAAEARLRQADAAIQQAERSLKAARQQLELAKEGRISVGAKPGLRENGQYYLFPNEASKKATLDRFTKEISDFEAYIDKTTTGMEKLKAIGYIVPDLRADELKVGEAGIIPVVVDIFQIVDGGNMLVKFSGKTFWLKISTKGFVDRESFSMTKPVEVVGTKTYRTANGASNTIYVLAPARLP